MVAVAAAPYFGLAAGSFVAAAVAGTPVPGAAARSFAVEVETAFAAENTELEGAVLDTELPVCVAVATAAGVAVGLQVRILYCEHVEVQIVDFVLHDYVEAVAALAVVDIAVAVSDSD